MSPTESVSIRPRESAVTAALAGAVVVVLAYASGFGLRTPLIAAPIPTAPSAPVEAVPEPTAVPVPTLAPIVIAAVPPPSPQPVASTTPTLPAHPATRTPTPSPSPTPTCTPGVVGSLLQPVSSLVDGLLGTGLVTGALGGVSCTVDGLLGSDCCSSQVAIEGKAR